MTDFFADLESHLRDATGRANERRRERRPKPAALLRAAAALVCVAAAVAAIATLAGDGDGAGEPASDVVREDGWTPYAPVQTPGCGAGAGAHVARRFGVLRRRPNARELRDGDDIAKVFADRDPVRHGTRLAHEDGTVRYWLVPVDCADGREAGVCVRRTDAAGNDARSCHTYLEVAGGTSAADERTVWAPVEDDVVLVRARQGGRPLRAHVRGNVAAADLEGRGPVRGLELVRRSTTPSGGCGAAPVEEPPSAQILGRFEVVRRGARAHVSALMREMLAREGVVTYHANHVRVVGEGHAPRVHLIPVTRRVRCEGEETPSLCLISSAEEITCGWWEAWDRRVPVFLTPGPTQTLFTGVVRDGPESVKVRSGDAEMALDVRDNHFSGGFDAPLEQIRYRDGVRVFLAGEEALP